jgi:hypothetical protein
VSPILISLMRILALLAAVLLTSSVALAQDTIIVQTLKFDSVGRSGSYTFPTANDGPFEKILMQYRMRCKSGLISTGSNRNRGCGEWDYNCETYITDPSRIDSVYQEWPSTVISNFSGALFPYSASPGMEIRRRTQYVTKSPVGALQTVTIGNDEDGIAFRYEEGSTRAIFLYKGSELTAKGLTTGKITALELFGLHGGVTFRNLMVRVRNVADTMDIDSNWITVFSGDYTLGLGDPMRVAFYRDFNWAGGDIQIDISHTAAPMLDGIAMTADTTSFVSGWISKTNEKALRFAGGEYIEVEKAKLTQINKEITFAAWVYGMPATKAPAGTLTEGVTNGQRAFNIHLPWDNGGVYFDCGNGTGYDRIEKPMPANSVRGRWNHWAFTKNATTGIMAMYLNGELVQRDTGRRRDIDIDELRVGMAMLSSNFFDGYIKDVEIYATALDISEVKETMKLDNDGVFGRPLVIAYPLTESSQFTMTGTKVWHPIRGSELRFAFEEVMARPMIGLSQATITTTKTEKFVYDTLAVNPRLARDYAIIRNDSVAQTGTRFLYAAGKQYIRDETGVIVDSFNVAATDTVRITQMPYYQKWPQKFELMSFVTPYGIGLDLGMEGKMWEFDVTDYATVLRGEKFLSVERGAWQEELDIRFLFVKGTPVRNVLDMQQLWPVTEENYQTINSNRRFQPITVEPMANSTMWKLRSMITGHGQEGEFIPRSHWIKVGEQTYEREVWKECADNPVYPQGGTWVYDRAGWCPGAPTDLAEYPLSLQAGIPVTFDYGVRAGSGDSRYVVSNQLVSYGAPNFTRDAAIVEVRRPSERVEFARINPTCNEPIIVIRNNGSEALTSLTINYSTSGGGERVYQWTGDLKFLETAEVTLPIGNLSFWGTATSGAFTASVANPNGQQDEYAKNDSYTSSFIQPAQYKGAIVLRLKANKTPEENFYEIRDINGTLIRENAGFDVDQVVYDSLVLPVGCYTLKFFDEGNDGLQFWANSAQGTGTLALRQDSRTGKVLKQFQTDFGAYTQFDFAITESLGVNESTRLRSLSIYPNPAKDVLKIDLQGFEGLTFEYRILGVTGRVFSRDSMRNGQIDIRDLRAGSYILELRTEEGTTHIPFVKS